jgi:hypothetical protein
MGAEPPGQVTRLLQAWSDGGAAALEQLIPLVYAELRRLANRYMDRERPGHTLQTSALINEAYLRLVDARGVRWQNRAHFFAVLHKSCGASWSISRARDGTSSAAEVSNRSRSMK